MSSLYILENGSKVSISQGQFVITNRQGAIKRIPQETVENITIFGNSGLTTPCIKHCLNNNVSVNFLSERGYYYGRISSTKFENPFRLYHFVL